MLECLALARKGAGRVSPNPMVGCVIVKGGRVIGRGFHARIGGPHAEVNAIRSASNSARGATLFVNLEPCNIHGRTPPCADLIIKSGIGRVVIGTRDPNPLVAGRGIRLLRRHGVKVTVGVLEEECRRFNEFFFKFITTRLPFVTLKVAQSLDGKIARKRGRSRWITGLKSRTYVHALRSQYDAVLVGAGTVKLDDPRLTVRHVRGRNPIRIVLDGRFRVPESAAVLRPSQEGAAILVVNQKSLRSHAAKAERLRMKGVVILGLDGDPAGRLPLNTLLRVLGSREIASVLVEGGASLFTSFVRERLCDKLLLFVAPAIFGGGLEPFTLLGRRESPVTLHDLSVMTLGRDALIEGYLH